MTNTIHSIRNQSVKLAAVDFADDTYRITTAAASDELIASIKNLGLLNSPVIIENNARFTIVCGFRRVEACRTLKWDNIPARILDPKTDKLACVQMAITDNALQRPLNLIEKSRAINLLDRVLTNDNDRAFHWSILGLPEHPSIIQKIKPLCHLSVDIQKAIQSDTIPLPVALKLDQLEVSDALNFVKLFEYLKPSLNKQREILTLVEEIAFRENSTMHQVLQENGLRDILQHEQLDINQKTRMIRRYLRMRRFPALTKAEQRFNRRMQALKLDKNIRLTPPQNFEGRNYTLTFDFKNLAELKDRKAGLDAIIQNPALEKILNITATDDSSS